MIITFDIGGTAIKYGLIDDDLNFIVKDQMKTNANFGGLSIIRLVISKIKHYQKEYDLKGVAISSAGVIDHINGTVMSATLAIPDYAGIEIKKMIEAETGLFTTVENDVNCVALQEASLLPDDIQDMLVMTIGTGIGGAIIINREIYHGHSQSAGEWGHMYIGGKAYEKQASITGMLNDAKDRGLDVSSGFEVFKLYDQGDYLAVSVVQRFYHFLSLGIANLIFTFNPQVLVVGGGISNRQDKFIEELNQVLNLHLPDYYLNSFTIRLATNLNDAGMLGAVIHHQNMKK